MSKSETSSDIMNRLYEEYGLFYNKDNVRDSDIFISPKFKIIRRSGIEKIQARAKIKGTYEVVHKTPCEIAIKGTFIDSNGNSIQTFGEASVDYKEIVQKETVVTTDQGTKSIKSSEEIMIKAGNVKQNPPYLFAMAEKRCKSRGVLQLAGLYEQGFYGEDESDDFSSEIRSSSRKANTPNGVKLTSKDIPSG